VPTGRCGEHDYSGQIVAFAIPISFLLPGVFVTFYLRFAAPLFCRDAKPIGSPEKCRCDCCEAILYPPIHETHTREPALVIRDHTFLFAARRAKDGRAAARCKTRT
jgi:hypothetical protein